MASKESLWDLAVKESTERLNVAGNSSSGERTLVIAGSKGAGKTTMIQRFLDGNEPIKETLALEYTFGRKSGRSLVKDICHIWELGGGTLFAHLLSSPFNVKKRDTSLVLVLDLSVPGALWPVMETLLQQVHSHYRRADTGAVAGDLEGAACRLGADHEDCKAVAPFPVPLLIVGAKYDLFQDMDPEKKKVICRSLRQVAHYLAASLLFYSDKDQSLVKRLKDAFNHHGFGGSQWKGYSTDHNKPLCIAVGSDSFAQIGTSAGSQPANTRSLSLDKYRHLYTSHFPEDTKSDKVDVDDPAKDSNFKEPVIDALRSQKDDELDRLRREVENRKRIAGKV